jgi:hypothetical protein
MEHAAVRRDNGSPVARGNGLLGIGCHNREKITRTWRKMAPFWASWISNFIFEGLLWQIHAAMKDS